MSANTTLRLAVTWYVPYECGDSSNELTLTEVEVRLYCTVLYCTVLHSTVQVRLGQDLRGLQDLIYERWHRFWPQRSFTTAAGERVAVVSLASIRAAASISNTGCKVASCFVTTEY